MIEFSKFVDICILKDILELNRYDLGRYALEARRTTDLVIATDGEIYNLPEVVKHINDTGRVSRTDVLIIRNKKEYEKWKGLGMKKTTIHDVQREEDLLGFAIGRAREIGRVAL